jgi:tetratricopeptide (TPR) repeat protein
MAGLWRPWLLVIALAVGLAIGLPLAAQGSIVDMQMQVTTALVQSALTIESLKKNYDAKIRDLLAQRDAATTAVSAGKAKQADITRANAALVAELRASDAGYKAEIDAFGGAVTDIASTPEGLAALARYNAGDQVGALAILDKLQAAYEKATDVQKAVGERTIAALAFDARDKGKVTTASVIARYEAVVKLDPGAPSDWIRLDGLYQDAGRTVDARKAAETAAKVAGNDSDKAWALSELGKLLQVQGDLAGAAKGYTDALAIDRRRVSAAPTNARAQGAVAEDLRWICLVLLAQDNLDGASNAAAEELAIARRLAAADRPSATAQIDLSGAWQRTGEVLQAQGDLVGAGKAYAEMLAVLRPLAAADPSARSTQVGLSFALEQTGDVLRQQNDLAGASKAYAEMVVIDERQVAADSTNAFAKRDVAVALAETGGDWRNAVGAGRSHRCRKDLLRSAGNLPRTGRGRPHKRGPAARHLESIVPTGEHRKSRCSLVGRGRPGRVYGRERHARAPRPRVSGHRARECRPGGGQVSPGFGSARKSVVLTALLAFALSAWLPAAVRAQASIVDTQMEVTTALVQSSITIEAVKKADDAKCRDLQARIDALEARVKAGKAQKADLVAAKAALVARLSDVDVTYKAEIAAFRGAVTDIASTPQGLAALARYNAGDQVGALAILDKLQAADEAARHAATAIDDAVGERRIAELALDARDKGKVTTASVIARYEAVVKLDPGVSTDWAQLDRLYQSAGRLPNALRAAETAAKTAAGDADRLGADDDVGDVLLAQGDLAGARASYEAGLALARRLAASQPTSAEAQRDLAVALERTGDAHRALGDLAGAAAAYGEELDLLRRLAAADPTNAVKQRDLAVALERAGDVSVALGELDGARKAYEEELAIARRLAAADPANADAQRDLEVALEKTSDVLDGQGELAGERSLLEETLSIARRLAAADPTSAVAERDLFVALTDLGDVLKLGDLNVALKDYEEGLDIARRLAAGDPSDAKAQADVSLALEKVGDVALARPDPAAALKAFDDSLAVARSAAAADPLNADAQRRVAALLSRLAQLPGSGVGWADVVAQLESMDHKGILAPADRGFLDQSRANAAGQPQR